MCQLFLNKEHAAAADDDDDDDDDDDGDEGVQLKLLIERRAPVERLDGRQ